MARFNKFLSGLISLTMLLTPQTLVSAEKAAPVSISNGNIEVFVSPENGGYMIRTKDGDVLNKDDDNKDLLYRSGDFDTSFTSIRITEEGKESEEYIFGNNYSFLGLGGNNLDVSKDDTGISAVWTVKNIEVTQRLEPVVDSASERHGMIKISYWVKNNRQKNVSVQARVLLDTALGEQDYAYYSIPQGNLPSKNIYSEAMLTGDEVPVYFEALDSDTAPSVIGYSVTEVAPDIVKPYQMTFAHWNNLASTMFDYTPNNEVAYVSAVNATYKTADSAVAAYYELGTISPSQSSSLNTFYGVRSRADFDPSQHTIDITLNAPSSLSLSADKSAYLDESGNPTGKFSVNTNLLNTADTYPNLTMAVYAEAGIIPLDSQGNDFSELPTRENPSSLYIYDLAPGNENSLNFNWNFRAEVDSRASLRRIEFKVYTPDTQNGLLIEENVIGSATMYILCPGGDGNVEKITFTSLSPDVVYTEGTRRLYVTGSGFDMLSSKSGYALKAYNVSDRSISYDIAVENLYFPNTGTMEIALSERMQPGTYELIFECGESLVQAGVAQRLTAPVLIFNVSDDPTYRNDSYGVLTVVKNDAQREMDMEYSVVTYDKEEDYTAHGSEELLLEFKGYFAKEVKDANTTVYTSVLGGDKNTVVINQALDFKNGTITITETKGDKGGVKFELDGKLTTNSSGTAVSDGKINISELKNGNNYELINYDDFGNRQDMGHSAEEIVLTWASDYLGYSMFDGFPIAIRDAVFGKIHKRETDGNGLGAFDGYTVSFGGAMNLKFLVPGELPLGIDAKDVVFGRNDGLLGVNAEGSVIIPSFARPIGSLAGTFSANTINDNYTVGVNGTIGFARMFEAEFELIVKASGEEKVPIPDRLALYFRDFRPGQPLGPPILFLTGGGGGYDELYDTVYAKGGIPPLTLDAMAQISLLQFARAEGAMKISLGGFAAKTTALQLEAIPITLGPSAEIAVNWAPEFYLYKYQDFQMVAPFLPPGLVRGSMQTAIGEVNDRFLAEMYVGAFIVLPTDFLLGTDITLAEAGLGISTERLWGVARVLGLGVGVAYYWGEGDLDLSMNDLDRYKPEYGSSFELNSVPVYYDEENERALLMDLGSNINAVNANPLYGNSAIASSEDGTSHTMTMGADAAGGVLLSLTYDEEVTEEWVKNNVSVVKDGVDYMDSAVFPTATEGQTNVSDSNAMLSTGEGKSILTISVLPEDIESGDWTITSGKKAEASMYVIDPLPEIRSVDAQLSNGMVNVIWEGTRLNETTIDFYLTDSAENAGTYLGTASDSSGNSELFEIPETLPSGSYYVSAIAKDEGSSFCRAVSTKTISHVNANTPSAPQSVVLTNIGNEYFRMDIVGADDADGYYVDVYERMADGSLAATDYTNIMFEKGDELLLGGNQTNENGSFGMFGGKTYVASVSAYKILNDGVITGQPTQSAPSKLDEYTPPEITYSGKEVYNTSEVSFTLSAKEAVTGTISIDDAAEGDGFISVTNEASKDVSLVLKDGEHKIRYSGKDAQGNSFLFEKLIKVDTQAPMLLLSSPVNGGLFGADGIVEISGITEPDAAYSIKVDGKEVLKSDNLSGYIGDDGVLKLDLNIGNDKDVKTLEIAVTDEAGNASVQKVRLKNEALGDIQGIRVVAEGAVINGKNIILNENDDTKAQLKLFGTGRNGAEFEITDARLVSWNVVTKNGNAEADVDGELTISPDAVGFVEAALQVGETGVLTDAVAFGVDNSYSLPYTVQSINIADGVIIPVITAQSDAPTATAIIAQYSSDGRLISVNTKAVNVSDVNITAPLEDGTDYIKCFVWAGAKDVSNALKQMLR